MKTLFRYDTTDGKNITMCEKHGFIKTNNNAYSHPVYGPVRTRSPYAVQENGTTVYRIWLADSNAEDAEKELQWAFNRPHATVRFDGFKAQLLHMPKGQEFGEGFQALRKASIQEILDQKLAETEAEAEDLYEAAMREGCIHIEGTCAILAADGYDTSICRQNGNLTERVTIRTIMQKPVPGPLSAVYDEQTDDLYTVEGDAEMLSENITWEKGIRVIPLEIPA